VYEWFDISFDHFGRTSTPQQTDICQEIFHKVLDNNWLSENTMQQVGVPRPASVSYIFHNASTLFACT
jgi:methionyl-tRNA synthetase